METKEIILPQGWEVEKIENGKIILKEVVETLPATWEEFCEKNPIKSGECSIGFASDVEMYSENDYRHSLYDKSVLPDKQTAEAFLALMQLIQLRDCYRQGWNPDWGNGDEWKFQIECYKGCVCAGINCTTSKVLSFQTKEIRDEFLENFRDLIVQAKELI